MKKFGKFILFGLTAAVAVGTALAGMTACNVESFHYDDAKNYSVGGATVSNTVGELEIEWLTGEVNVVYGDVETVTFSEKSDETLSKERTLHNWLDGVTLHIKYAESGIKLTNVKLPEKALTVTLPNALALNGLEIETVDADISVQNIKASDVEIENIAGSVTGVFDGVREFSVDMISGNADLRFLTAPSEGSYKNVSGNVTLYLPDGTGFTADVELLAGGFNTSFETTERGDEIIVGDGVNEYEFESVSGNVRVEKLPTVSE